MYVHVSKSYGASMRALSVVVGLTIGLALAAQGTLAQEMSGGVPHVRSIVVPRADLPAQATPPNFFGFSGRDVGVAKSEQPYVVIRRHSYPSLTGDAQDWLQIAPAPNSQGKNESQAGGDSGFWVYYGRTGTSGNLQSCTNCMVGR
jgi:hypothetical protein